VLEHGDRHSGDHGEHNCPPDKARNRGAHQLYLSGVRPDGVKLLGRKPGVEDLPRGVPWCKPYEEGGIQLSQSESATISLSPNGVCGETNVPRTGANGAPVGPNGP
jgi:hypothetical protein